MQQHIWGQTYDRWREGRAGRGRNRGGGLGCVQWQGLGGRSLEMLIVPHRGAWGGRWVCRQQWLARLWQLQWPSWARQARTAHHLTQRDAQNSCLLQPSPRLRARVRRRSAWVRGEGGRRGRA